MASEIKKYRFKPDIDLQLEIVYLKKLTSENKEHLIHPHRTIFYHVFLFENCSPKHFIDFTPVQSKPYTLLFVTKDQIQQFDPALKYKGRILIFTEDFFCTTEGDSKFLRSTILFNDLSGNPCLQISRDTFNYFSEQINTIEKESRLPIDAVKHTILKNLVHNFLLWAEREKQKQDFSGTKKGVDWDYTLLYKDMLEQCYTSTKSVSIYAQKLHISEKKLGQATSKVLGKTPKELIDERVLLEAKRLLVHDNKSIKEIGFFLGFEEATNFIKYFRKHTSKTPLEFREQYLPK